MDAFACRNDGRNSQMICVLSASGPERTISRLRAVLQSNSKVRMRGADMPAPFYRWRYAPTRCDAGYIVHRTKLDFNTWHIMAVAKVPELLQVMDDETLWQKLSSDAFTTPVLRSWVPWLKERLIEDCCLSKLDCFQCETGWLSLDSSQLDDYVSKGVKSGQLEVK